jgi:thiosulfate/3-mercaptopyruvate sulfurtransferase
MIRLLWAGCLLSLAGVLRAESPTEYARPEMLIEAGQLEKRLDDNRGDKKVVILDTRPQEEFEKGHLPGAQWVDIGKWKSEFGEGTDAKDWQQRIGKLGINRDTPVVVYDGALTGSAARAWWILRYWGVKDVKLLNGGTKAWEAEEFDTTTEVAKVEPVKFEVQAQEERLVTYDELKEQLKHAAKVQLVDARTDVEFEAGRIAACNHLDWKELVDSKTGKLLPAKELLAKLQQAGFEPDQPMITYCESGGRASVMAFALELMGGKHVANYYGSWSDWQDHEEPADR